MVRRRASNKEEKESSDDVSTHLFDEKRKLQKTNRELRIAAVSK